MKKNFIILFILLGIFLCASGQTDSTIELDSLYKLRKEVRDRDRISIDLQIAKIYNKTSSDSLETYIHKLSSYIEDDGNTLIEAYIHKFRANLYEDRVQLDSSIILLKNALQLFRELGDYDEMGDVASSIGSNYLDLGNISSASEMFLQSLAYYESTENRFGLATVHNNLGKLSFRNGYFDQAMEYFNSSLGIFEELNIPEKCYSLYNNLGITEYNINNYDVALELYTKSYEGFALIEDHAKMSTVGANIALCHSSLGQFDLAIEFLNRSMDILIEYDDKIGHINCLFNLAYCNRLSGNFNLSDMQLDSALSMAVGYDLKGLESEIYHEYSILQHDLGNFKEAYNYLFKHDSLNAIVKDNDAQKRIEGLQISYEHQIKEQELVQLRADQKMQSRLNNIFLLVIILAFVLVVILVYGSISNRRQSSLLEEKNKLLKDYNNRLIDSEDSLKEVIKDKNRLFSIIAHDIKNPIAAVEGFSELLYENFEELDDSTRKEYIYQIQKGAASTGELLENLLLWARSQMDKVTLNKTEVQVSKIVNEGITPIISSLEKKNLELQTDIQSSLFIKVDIEMVKAVIRNLVTNAVKFSFPGKVIKINAFSEDSNVNIVIKDEGIGMSEEKLEKLFSSQFNISTPGTSGEVGSGLGLLIVKDYVDRNGGTISVKSEAGIGSVFTISFPNK